MDNQSGLSKQIPVEFWKGDYTKATRYEVDLDLQLGSNTFELTPVRPPLLSGRGNFKADTNILTDPKADFRGSDLKEAVNLQIHWETPEDAGINYGYDINEKPNSRVYKIVEIIDRTRLRIYPEYQNSGPIENDNTASYSIFRPNPWFLVFRIIIEDIIE